MLETSHRKSVLCYKQVTASLSVPYWKRVTARTDRRLPAWRPPRSSCPDRPAASAHTRCRRCCCRCRRPAWVRARTPAGRYTQPGPTCPQCTTPWGRIGGACTGCFLGLVTGQNTGYKNGFWICQCWEILNIEIVCRVVAKVMVRIELVFSNTGGDGGEMKIFIYGWSFLGLMSRFIIFQAKVTTVGIYSY